jgi:hypothetical protein
MLAMFNPLPKKAFISGNKSRPRAVWIANKSNKPSPKLKTYEK